MGKQSIDEPRNPAADIDNRGRDRHPVAWINSYRRTGNLRELLLGHRKIESTVRYLGIDVNEALTIAEQVDVQLGQSGRSAQARLVGRYRGVPYRSFGFPFATCGVSSPL